MKTIKNSRAAMVLVVAALALLTVGTQAGPSIADGVRHAMFAHNADKVDGKHAVSSAASLNNAKRKLVAHNNQGQLPDKYIAKPSKITTTHGHAEWVPNTAVQPSTITRFTDTTRVSADGFMEIGLQAPQSSGSATYGLAKVEVCYDVQAAPGRITDTGMYVASATGVHNVLVDATDRTSPTHNCYSVGVGRAVPYGATLYIHLADGGSVDLNGVRATWTRAAAKVAPRAVAPRSGAGHSGD